MADEDAVDQIVRRLGHHADDARQGKTEQQPRNAGLAELYGTIHANADQAPKRSTCDFATLEQDNRDSLLIQWEVGWWGVG